MFNVMCAIAIFLAQLTILGKAPIAASPSKWGMAGAISGMRGSQFALTIRQDTPHSALIMRSRIYLMGTNHGWHVIIPPALQQHRQRPSASALMVFMTSLVNFHGGQMLP